MKRSLLLLFSAWLLFGLMLFLPMACRENADAEKGPPRFTVTWQAEFQHAYQCDVYLIVDTHTGREYLAVEKSGIVELGKGKP